MATPTFSIVIPAYNVADTLQRCVDSIANQITSNDEIVIVDDCSADETLSIANELANCHQNIKVVAHEVNKGRAKARKTGIEAATCSHLLFLDADDEFSQGSIAAIKEAVAKHNAEITHFGLQFLNRSEQGDEVRLPEREGYFAPFEGMLHDEDVFKKCFCESRYAWNLANKCFDAKLCKKALAYASDDRVQRGDDAYLYFIMSFFAKSYFGMVGTNYYIYHFGSGQDNFNQITAQQFEAFLDSCDAHNKMKGFLQAVPHEEFHKQGLVSAGLELVSGCVYRMKAYVKPEERGEAFKLLLKYWETPLLVTALRRHYSGTELELFRAISEQDFPDKRPDKKYVATFYHQLYGGGVEGVLRNLIDTWKSLGYEVILLLNKEPDPELLAPLGVADYVVLEPADGPEQQVYQREETIQSVLQKYPIDLVVYHAWIDKALPWDMISFKQAGVSFVIHCQGFFPNHVLAVDPYFASMPYIYALADGVVSLSETDRSLWARFNSNTFVTVNPPTYPCADISPNNLSGEGKNVLWLGRVSPEKHPEDIVRIFELVSQQLPDAHLTMVGSANTVDYDNHISNLIANSSAADKIQRVPWTDNQKAYYEKADLFVMTSEIEGYPLTLAESKTFGLPCVMYNLPYLTLVQDGRGITTVPFGDIVAFAAKIVEVLSDEKLRQSMGIQARESIEELSQFDYKKLWSDVFASSRQKESRQEERGCLEDCFLDIYALGAQRVWGIVHQLEHEKLQLQLERDEARHENEHIIAEYRSSNSWKAGRIITWPVRFIKRIKNFLQRKFEC